MKKQFFLLTLILFGAVYFPSLNNNAVNACDKTCRAACFTVKKPAVKVTVTDYEEDEYNRVRPLQFPFVTL